MSENVIMGCTALLTKEACYEMGDEACLSRRPRNAVLSDICKMKQTFLAVPFGAAHEPLHLVAHRLCVRISRMAH